MDHRFCQKQRITSQLLRPSLSAVSWLPHGRRGMSVSIRTFLNKDSFPVSVWNQKQPVRAIRGGISGPARPLRPNMLLRLSKMDLP